MGRDEADLALMSAKVAVVLKQETLATTSHKRGRWLWVAASTEKKTMTKSWPPSGVEIAPLEGNVCGNDFGATFSEPAWIPCYEV